MVSSFVSWQAKSSDPVAKRKCPSCKSKLPEGWKKTLCQACIDLLVKEDASSACSDLIASVKKELDATIQSFRSSLANPSLSQPTTSQSSQGSLIVPVMETEASPTPEGHSPSQSEDSDEGEEGENLPSRFKLSLEQVDGLLKAIYTTLGLEEERKELSLHDKMYAGLSEHKNRNFPVHSVISEAIKKEWAEPERKPFFPKALKRRFPFDEDPAAV